MPATPTIDVVCDANVVIKWFHDAGEQEVEASRGLLDRQRDRTIALHILDLTPYEIGNVLLQPRFAVGAQQVATVLTALAEVCRAIAPSPEDLADAAQLAEQHALTFYDATYAAVARRRRARLVTLDGALLGAELGLRPGELAATLG